jgi:NTP pyrophosphatase (non-canonical NTP hydrolase)
MASSSPTLHQLTDEIVAVYKRYEATGTAKWTHEIAAKDLAYQLGSLTKALMQLRGERHAGGKTPEQLRAAVGDELADILAETLFIARELDIDLAASWQAMVASDDAKITERVPVP